VEDERPSAGGRGVAVAMAVLTTLTVLFALIAAWRLLLG